jgi:hypothetical protein
MRITTETSSFGSCLDSMNVDQGSLCAKFWAVYCSYSGNKTQILSLDSLQATSRSILCPGTFPIQQQSMIPGLLTVAGSSHFDPYCSSRLGHAWLRPRTSKYLAWFQVKLFWQLSTGRLAWTLVKEKNPNAEWLPSYCLLGSIWSSAPSRMTILETLGHSDSAWLTCYKRD